MLLGWDDLAGSYVAYARPTTKEGNPVRRIGRSTSDDFIDWTDPQEVLVPDSDDPPAMEFYGMPVFRYEGHYLGLLYAYQARPEEPRQRNFGTIDVQLASSRDGVDWERSGDRTTFLPNGPAGSIDAGEIYMAREPVLVDDELWFYYSPGTMEHGVTGRSGPLCLAKLRLDGFVSVDGGDETGALHHQADALRGRPAHHQRRRPGRHGWSGRARRVGHPVPRLLDGGVRQVRRRLPRPTRHLARQDLPRRAQGQGHQAQVLSQERQALRLQARRAVTAS